MLKFEWNALRVGAHVGVHDDADSGLLLSSGVVCLVQTAPDHNDVAIAVDHEGARTVVRPRRQAVHLLPLDTAERCWRCDEGVTS